MYQATIRSITDYGDKARQLVGTQLGRKEQSRSDGHDVVGLTAMPTRLAAARSWFEKFWTKNSLAKLRSMRDWRRLKKSAPRERSAASVARTRAPQVASSKPARKRRCARQPHVDDALRRVGEQLFGQAEQANSGSG